MRLKYALASTVLAGAAVIGFAPTAQADPPSSRCEIKGSATQAFCYFYNSGQNGAVAGWDTTNFSGFKHLADAGTFISGTGNGGGTAVWNHAASATYVRNGGCGGYVRSYFNTQWSGVYDTIYACSGINLVKTHDQNASFQVFN
jgi:hypothetical protein